MAYIINRFDGSQLVAVEDGTVDQTTDLKLIGKNYSGYGEVQNENMLFLLENFANTTPPTKAISGQVWFDSATNKLKFYTGVNWKNAGGAEVAASQPAGLNEGDLWYSTSTNQLYARTGAGEFILVGPQSAGDGATQMLSVTVLDAGSVEKSVVLALINDVVVYVISNSEFTPAAVQSASTPDLSAFPVIKRGITLVNTDSDGVTTNAGDTGEPIYWGTASNALKLNGQDAANYIAPDVNGDVSLRGVGIRDVYFKDRGIKIGDSSDLVLKVDVNVASIQNQVGDTIHFAASRGGVAPENIVSVVNTDATNAGLVPASDDTYNLGTPSLKYAKVYATSFDGTATKATQVVVNGTGRIARDAGTSVQLQNTIAARDASGNIVANLFNGTATSARYADLAEKYGTASELPVGTAVAVGNANDDSEVVPATSSDLAIGVVSDAPAYLMNSEAEGQAIGLKGRVPVRIAKPVSKGQAVYAWENGVCTTTPTRALVGIALETNEDEGEKLVECVLKT